MALAGYAGVGLPLGAGSHEKSFELRSRRMCNLPYVLFILSLNTYVCAFDPAKRNLKKICNLIKIHPHYPYFECILETQAGALGFAGLVGRKAKASHVVDPCGSGGLDVAHLPLGEPPHRRSFKAFQSLLKPSKHLFCSHFGFFSLDFSSFLLISLDLRC